MGSRFLLPLLLLLSWSAAAADASHCPEPVTHLVIDKGKYFPVPGAAFLLQNFMAEMVSRDRKEPGCFARSTRIEHGQVFISAESLTNFFDRKIQESGTKLSNVAIEFKDGIVHLKGKAHKGIEIPFDVEAAVSTDGNAVIVQAKKIKSAGLPMKGLLDMLGLHLAALINPEHVSGVVAKQDKLIFEPSKIADIHGRIEKASVAGNGLEIIFGRAAQNRQTAGK